jgi:hypothetical protein
MARNLMGLFPSRPPFSDWLSQVERKVCRVRGNSTLTPDSVLLLRSCYDVGLSANEVAIDLLETTWKGPRP